MIRARAVGAVFAFTAVFLGGGCSGGSSAKPAPGTTTVGTRATGGISEAEAITTAKAAWAKQDPDFDFAKTRPEADAIANNYDVAFVDATFAGPGGEPHVVVDRTTGAVVRTYRTK